MEKPYAGRATVTDNFDHLEIVIPAYRNGFVVMFLTVWILGWLFFEINAIETAMNEQIRPLDIFLDLWLIGWTIGGLFAIRMFIWMLFGKEIVRVGQGELSLSRRYAFFIKPKTYLLKSCLNFRVMAEPKPAWNRRDNSNIGISDLGTIRFDYGMKTIKFGGGLDEAEANHLLQKLKDKKILTAHNFASIA